MSHEHARAQHQPAERPAGDRGHGPGVGKTTHAMGAQPGAAASQQGTLFKGTPWSQNEVTPGDVDDAKALAAEMQQAADTEIAAAQRPNIDEKTDDPDEKQDEANEKRPAEHEGDVHDDKDEPIEAKGDDSKDTKADDGAGDGGGDGGDDDADEGNETEDGEADAGGGAGSDDAKQHAHGGDAAGGGEHHDAGGGEHGHAIGGGAHEDIKLDGAPALHAAPAGEHAEHGEQAMHAELAQDRAHDAKHAEVEDNKDAAYAHVDAAMQPDGGGQALEGDLREQMEDAVGADLGDVRLHTGGPHVDVLGQLGAKAAAKGRHVLFAQGFDQETLEHELHHVVQHAHGRVGNTVATTAGFGERVKLESEAERRVSQNKDEKKDAGKRAGKRKPKEQLRLANGGPAMFLFGVHVPNPIDVAKDVGGAVVDGVKAGGKAVVHAGKAAFDGVKKTVGKIAGFVKDAVTKVVGYVRDAVRGVMSAVRHLKDVAKFLCGLPIIGPIFSPVVHAIEGAAEKAAKLYRETKRRVAQFIAGARKLTAYTAKLAKRGPAYFKAARIAASNVVKAGYHAAGDVYERGKDAVKAALKEVEKQGKRVLAAGEHAVRVAYQGVKNAAKAVARATVAAGKWLKKNSHKIANIAETISDVGSLLPPPAGPVFAVAGALTHAAEGEWKEAALSMVGAIPEVGAAAKAGAYGARGEKVALKLETKMDKMFVGVKTIGKAAHTRALKAGKTLAKIETRATAKFHDFNVMLGNRFDNLEAGYRDFKPRVTTFVKSKRTQVHNFHVDLLKQYHANKETAEKIKKVKDWVDKVKDLNEDWHHIKEDWFHGPAEQPINKMAPAPGIA